ncbi:MAG: adaptor protein MecA, partial [Lactobacillaceae bacterium]|nr:adaptor protein MecA [Lactobacillaceae bacterium]
MKINKINNQTLQIIASKDEVKEYGFDVDNIQSENQMTILQDFMETLKNRNLIDKKMMPEDSEEGIGIQITVVKDKVEFILTALNLNETPTGTNELDSDIENFVFQEENVPENIQKALKVDLIQPTKKKNMSEEELINLIDNLSKESRHLKITFNDFKFLNEAVKMAHNNQVVSDLYHFNSGKYLLIVSSYNYKELDRIEKIFAEFAK